MNAGRMRFGFRLVHYSVQRDHLHLLVEAVDRRALTRGMQGLEIRMAKALNALRYERGKVFADRYHVRALRTPREVRNALSYVLNNYRRHQYKKKQILRARWLDPYSSSTYFDGWKEIRAEPLGDEAPVLEPATWLLRVGWRRHGPIPIDEIPGA